MKLSNFSLKLGHTLLGSFKDTKTLAPLVLASGVLFINLIASPAEAITLTFPGGSFHLTDPMNWNATNPQRPGDGGTGTVTVSNFKNLLADKKPVNDLHIILTFVGKEVPFGGGFRTVTTKEVIIDDFNLLYEGILGGPYTINYTQDATVSTLGGNRPSGGGKPAYNTLCRNGGPGPCWDGSKSFWTRNTVRQPVPGPLPILGIAAAFGYSRKLRKRIKASRPEVISTTAV